MSDSWVCTTGLRSLTGLHSRPAPPAGPSRHDRQIPQGKIGAVGHEAIDNAGAGGVVIRVGQSLQACRSLISTATKLWFRACLSVHAKLRPVPVHACRRDRRPVVQTHESDTPWLYSKQGYEENYGRIVLVYRHSKAIASWPTANSSPAVPLKE